MVRQFGGDPLRPGTLDNVPKNARGIAEVEHSDSPRLHRRRLAHDPGILLGEFSFLDVFPPRVQVPDAEAHHEIARVIGYIEFLQQESTRSDLQLGDFVIAPVGREAEIGVEGFRKLVISRGYKCLDIDDGTRNHRFSIWVDSKKIEQKLVVDLGCMVVGTCVPDSKNYLLRSSPTF